LKIAYFTDTYIPNTDGVVTSIKLVAEYLRKTGNEVYIFCPSGIIEDEYTIPIPSKKYQKYPQYKVSFPSFEVLTKIREINPDLIHVQTPVTIGLTGLYFGKILNIPIITTYHTRLDSYMWYIRSKNDEHFTDLFTTWLYNQCPVIVPSKSIKQILIDKNVNSQIQVIPNPVNLNLVSNRGTENRKPVILHVGRLCREKRIDSILRAFKKIVQKYDAQLLVTSTGPDEERLKKYVQDLDLVDKVTFTGYLSIEGLMKVYSRSDIFVAASDSETQGLVVLEAMANGCAVIARNAPGFKDVIANGKNGLLFDNEKELEDKLLILLRDLKLRTKLTTEGYNTVENFKPEKIVENLLDYYRINLSQEREPTVERLLYSGSLMFSFFVYLIVRKLDLPINSRLTNISVDVLKLFLRFAKFFRI
jgi:1,2-diacylglycerol 3-alpha-glucosyltransferase